VNLSTDGQRPGERMMLILGLRFLGRTRPGEHPKGRVFRSTWVENKKNASRMPPDQRSDMGATVSTTQNQRKCSLKAARPLNDTDNACSLGLHFGWLDGSPESYILKWLDTAVEHEDKMSLTYEIQEGQNFSDDGGSPASGDSHL